MSDPFREPVSLSDPDPAWAQQYADAAAQIGVALDGLAPTIEHIGSTSVPLRGKPIIDIQIAIGGRRRAAAIGALEELGYSHHGEGNVPGRDYLTRRPAGGPSVNVHLFGLGDSLLDDNRMVRDYLRENPEAAREYVAAKEKALAQGHADLLSYSHAKGSRVAAIREAAHRAKRRPSQP
jgi:GrpB-like predicted nucleotidyltransferase (UPF0157 family)